jgi:GT2 family glycosyltransferase
MVSVLICTYNSAKVLPGCLRSLAQQEYGPMEIIIVDNASSDPTREILATLGAPYKVILNDQNAGFSAAQNLALQHAQGEWLLCLNADVVLQPDFISQLVRAGESNPRLGTVCGKLLRWRPGADQEFSSVVDSTGMYFSRNLRHFDRGSEIKDRGQYDRVEYVFGATGAAALFRREMVEDVSLDGEFFDVEFFAYREDADLAWRAQLMGWRCLYVPTAVGWHVRHVTPSRFSELPLVINWHSVKNRFLMRMKNLGTGNYLRLWWPVTKRDLMIVGYCILIDRRLLSGFWRIWRIRKSVWDKRKKIQDRRRVNEGEMLSWFSDHPIAKPVEALQQSTAAGTRTAASVAVQPLPFKRSSSAK